MRLPFAYNPGLVHSQLDSIRHHCRALSMT